MGNTIIVGAGVAGLTLAERLAEGGHQVVVLEKERSVGGLARSFRYGDFTFDIGPHRFHAQEGHVTRLLERVLGDDLLRIKRCSAVWMFGRYFDWPLNKSSLVRLPAKVVTAVGRDLLRRRESDGESLADYVRHRYGQTLYEMFFKPYTERFVGIACEELSRDWATTGIERALIDRRIRAANLRQLAGSAFASRRPLHFIYPAGAGVGEFAARLARLVRTAGAEVLTECEVSRLRYARGRVSGVQAGGRSFECERLIWTGPVTQVAALLGLGDPQLPFLHLVLYNFRLRGACPIPYQWCYYSAEDVPFSRISVPIRFDPTLAPAGHCGLCVEVTAREGSLAWENPEALKGDIMESLVRLGLTVGPEEVVGVEIERIPNAYPIYTLGYRQRLREVRSSIEALGNVRLLGRGATFWYNNMDHSMRAAMRLAEDLEQGG